MRLDAAAPRVGRVTPRINAGIAPGIKRRGGASNAAPKRNRRRSAVRGTVSCTRNDSSDSGRKMTNNDAPLWAQFLDVRRRLINEFRQNGKSCTDIAEMLSMDSGQVYLISQVEHGEPPDDARAAILEVRDRVTRYFAERK